MIKRLRENLFLTLEIITIKNYILWKQEKLQDKQNRA